MSSGRRVVIIGIASRWGAELARRLERDPSVDYLAGVDSTRPAIELERTDFIEADIRSAVLSRLLPGTGADTIVHCGILWYPEPGKPARILHDVNVIGTLQLLAACQRTDTLRRLVVRGSAAIYGCEGASPSFFTEEMARRLPLRTRFQRDVSELEAYVDNFSRRHPDVLSCTLRFQPEIGPDLDAPLARYLSLPVVPTQLGFDPRLQLLHADDATEALAAATRNPVRGAVNVAPSGSISLSHILRLARRASLPIPHPLFGSCVGPPREPPRRRPALWRRGQAPALRPRHRQSTASNRDRLPAPLRRGGRGAGLRQPSCAAGESAPRCTPGTCSAGWPR